MTGRRRIALFSEHYAPRYGGIESHVEALAKRLLRAGHEVSVLTTFPGPDVVDGVSVRRFDIPRIPIWSSAYTPVGIRPLQRLFEQGGFDAVHCHTSVYSPAVIGAVFLAQRTRLPTVVTFHSIMRGYTSAYALLDRWVHWTEWPVTFTAVSSDIAAQVARMLRARGHAATVPVLANGIDSAAWSAVATTVAATTTADADVDADADADAPATTGDRVVELVSTIRLAPRKRPRALVEMFDAARRRLPQGTRLRLTIIGDGPEHAAVTRLVERLDLGDDIVIAGRQSHAQIRAAYARADAFVLPSVEESFGIAALEARAAGLPVIAMAGGGVRAFIRDGREGLLAASDADMVAAIVRMAVDADLRASIALHNRSEPAPYDWDDVIAAHLRVYDDAAA